MKKLLMLVVGATLLSGSGLLAVDQAASQPFSQEEFDLAREAGEFYSRIFSSPNLRNFAQSHNIDQDDIDRAQKNVENEFQECFSSFEVFNRSEKCKSKSSQIRELLGEYKKVKEVSAQLGLTPEKFINAFYFEELD